MRYLLFIKIACSYAWARKWFISSAVILGVAAGILLGYSLCDLPQIEKLDEGYRPDLVTKIYSDTGEVIHEFANQKRVLIPYHQIPENFKNALIAVEDARFYNHWGVDVIGISRAMMKNLRENGNALKGQGASTLTQQLTKLLFLTPEKTVSRKIKEAILALQVELKYSKEQILEMYSNQVYFGEGVYGIESASRIYFSKTALELELDEAALLAGLPQRPNYYNPVKSPERAKVRRDHVLSRMREEGFISDDQLRAASEKPVIIAESDEKTGLGAYFVEEVRKTLIKEYGAKKLYSGGLEISTTLNAEMQFWAETALKNGLRELDKAFRKYRGVILNINETEVPPEELFAGEWEREIIPEEIFPGIITQVSKDKLEVRIRDEIGFMPVSGASWANIKGLPDTFKTGDAAMFKIDSIGENGIVLSLEQIPEVQGAIVVIDNNSGAVKALSGGYSFELSKFNRATQALRQTGSAFKPMVYASALECGYTLADRLFDRPTVFVDRDTFQFYKPENYSHDYSGIITLRQALEQSRNIVSVELLTRIGYEPVIELARNLGIKSNLKPYPSLALGASEVTLLDMTSAFSAFPNQGVRVLPRLIDSIEFADNNEKIEFRTQPLKIMNPESAFLISWALKGVIQRGTGKSASELGPNIGGKTGTTDDYTDAWFCGFSSRYTVGVWVGYDKKKTLGRGMTGARAALPIWKDFMGKLLDVYGAEEFRKPENIIFVPLDVETGLRATMNSNCRNIILEAFIAGTEPVMACSDEIHRLAEEEWNAQLEMLKNNFRSLNPESIPRMNVLSPSVRKKLIEKLGSGNSRSKSGLNASECLSAIKRENNLKVTVLK